MKDIDPVALFRLAVLGPVISRPRLSRGEQKELLEEIAARDYDIPGTVRRHIAAKTLHEWLLTYRREGVEGLAPKARSDQGSSKLSAAVQERLLEAKRENPRRSIRVLRAMLEREGLVGRGRLSRSAIHRFLQQHGLSRPSGSASMPQERRSFLAEHANDIWYGDVMHGPRVFALGRLRKSYLVTLMDDASRLVAHSAFCLAETAVQIEGVLKQAVLKRGLAHKLVVDNGAAYRSRSLQGICARLGISLVYCRPYHPEGKGKLERWHKTLRDQFLTELGNVPVHLHELNSRLWAWIEEVYHRRIHGGLARLTPLARYQQDLGQIRLLGPMAAKLEEIFQHRVERLVRKDGTVSYCGRWFELPYELSGKKVRLVVDPHTGRVEGVEDSEGRLLGHATPQDLLLNTHRARHKPADPDAEPVEAAPPKPRGPTLIDHATKQHYRPIDDAPTSQEE
jgi:transposase InsO family protein